LRKITEKQASCLPSVWLQRTWVKS
jgi:hypothetical protein